MMNSHSPNTIRHRLALLLCLAILLGWWTGASAVNDIADLRTRAEAGDASAQATLGRCYYFGTGVSKDPVEAHKWWRKAADQGNALGQNGLGVCYAAGAGGMAKDSSEAVKWYRKAAEQGFAKAQRNLGICYFHGDGVSKDPTMASDWFRKAAEGFRKEAEQGDAGAQFDLGACYASGLGVPKDPVEAVKWYRKAAEQGDAAAQYCLSANYASGDGVGKDLIEGVKWLYRAAEQGYANAQCGIGNCYLDGRGVAKDPTEAVKWYRKAAEQGFADAQFNLGACYANAIGVPKDPVEAVKWYRKAAEQGNTSAQAELARGPETQPSIQQAGSRSETRGMFAGQQTDSPPPAENSNTQAQKAPASPPRNIFEAIQQGNLAKVKGFVAQGTDVNVRTRGEPRFTALTVAVIKNARDIAEFLIHEGADINLGDDRGWTPLHWACFKGNAAMVGFLLSQKGIQLDARDKGGVTVAMFATRENKPECLRLLLDAGASYKRSTVTAAFLGDAQALQEQLANGGDPNEMIDGWTPLTAASRHGHCDAITLLLSKGADINTPTKDQEETPLHLAAGFGHVQAMRVLLERQPRIDCKTKDGATPLASAISCCRAEAAKLLIAKGASVSDRMRGESMLSLAVEAESLKTPPSTVLVKLLLDAGADVNSTNQSNMSGSGGITPLMAAAHYLNPFVVKCLLDNGAKLSARSERGATALMMAKETISKRSEAFEDGAYGNETIRVLMNPDAPVDFSAAPPKQGVTSLPSEGAATVRSDTMTKQEWKSRLYSNYPHTKLTGGAGIGTTIEDFVSKMGRPSKTQTIGKEAYWYYKCSDGDIQMVLLADGLQANQFLVTGVNDY